MTAMKPLHLTALLAATACVITSCSTQPEAKQPPAAKTEPVQPALPPNPLGVPGVYKVRLDTSKGPVVIEVHREWAPRGADRFWELVKEGFYTEARFFRIVKNYVAQFGLAANPAMTKKWEEKLLDDDPVVRTNRVGAVSFASQGPNTRTTQVFINLRSNMTLDDRFAPFGQVVEGMENIEKLYSKHGEAPNQEQIRKRGNAYLKQNFPALDYIRKAEIMP